MFINEEGRCTLTVLESNVGRAKFGSHDVFLAIRFSASVQINSPKYSLSREGSVAGVDEGLAPQLGLWEAGESGPR